MADNNVDVPVLICKLLAAATCTTGCILEGNAITGFKDATTDTGARGIIAMEPGAAGYYFSAMVMGTAYMKVTDTVKAATAVQWIAADEVDAVDTATMAIGTLIDGATDSSRTTNKHRVFFNGKGMGCATW